MGANSEITVVITCFNYGAYLHEAVSSALEQTGGPPFVIVVDDGSSDAETEHALAELPPEVHVLRQANAGACAARNAGLADISTAYALVLDADDRLAAGALGAMRSVLEDDPTIGFAYGLMEQFGARSGVLRFPPYDPYALLFRHTIGLTALMRRAVVEETGGFDPSFTAFEDWEFWVNALSKGFHGRQLDRVTLEYRRHAGSKHASDRTAYRSAWRAIRYKHRALYAQRRAIRAESSMSAASCFTHRFLWGPRPWPEALERALYARVFRSPES